jgi:hypothetical protein
VGSNARVPEDARDLQETEASRGIAEEYRAAIEEETHGSAPSNEHAGATGVRVYPRGPECGLVTW